MSWLIGAAIVFISFLVGGGSLLLFAIASWEKFEKIIAQLYKVATGVFKGAHKQYLRHDIQGRVNDFAKNLTAEAPYLAETRVQVDFINEGVDRKAFLKEGKVVLRLRRNDEDDMNFVHGAYLFVSTSLLSKAKRYVSQSQGQAIDLYVTTKLLQKEKARVVGTFLDEYLHPRVGDDSKGKTAHYYDDIAKLDAGGYFYPVLLQELDFLGNKVFGLRRDEKIISEVDELISFLADVATRPVGQRDDMNFEREYCRFAIAIVGKREKVASDGAQPYLGYLRGSVIPANIESIYLRGPAENCDVIDVICSQLDGLYERVATRTYAVKLLIDDHQVESDQYLAVLRKRGAEVFRPSQSGAA